MAWFSAETALPDLFTVGAAGNGRSASAWRDTDPHPWRRYFARVLDNTVVGGLTWFLIGVAAFSYDPATTTRYLAIFHTPFGSVLDAMLTVLVSIPGNALMIGLTGLSLGKWIFGVRVLKNSAPIGFWAAFRREFSIWIFGFGAGIPLISIATLIGAYARLTGDRTTRWDRAQRIRVQHRPKSVFATLSMGLVVCLLLGTIIGLRLYSMRGAGQ